MTTMDVKSKIIKVSSLYDFHSPSHLKLMESAHEISRMCREFGQGQYNDSVEFDGGGNEDERVPGLLRVGSDAHGNILYDGCSYYLAFNGSAADLVPIGETVDDLFYSLFNPNSGIFAPEQSSLFSGRVYFFSSSLSRVEVRIDRGKSAGMCDYIQEKLQSEWVADSPDHSWMHSPDLQFMVRMFESEVFSFHFNRALVGPAWLKDFGDGVKNYVKDRNSYY